MAAQFRRWMRVAACVPWVIIPQTRDEVDLTSYGRQCHRNWIIDLVKRHWFCRAGKVSGELYLGR